MSIVHNLTTDQLEKLIEAIGRHRVDWPKITDDPLVNYAVDCLVQGDDEAGQYDVDLYAREVKAWSDFYSRGHSPSGEKYTSQS